MLFIGSGTRSEEIVQYYAVHRLLLFSSETFPVLRDCRRLFALLMRHYYASGDFRMLVKRQQPRLRIAGLEAVMERLLELRTSTRLTLDGVFESEMFKSARTLSAERNAMVVQ